MDVKLWKCDEGKINPSRLKNNCFLAKDKEWTNLTLGSK